MSDKKRVENGVDIVMILYYDKVKKRNYGGYNRKMTALSVKSCVGELKKVDNEFAMKVSTIQIGD